MYVISLEKSQFPYKSCQPIFVLAGNNPVVLKNSTEHAETLLIALIAHLQLLLETVKLYTITLEMADQGRSDFYVVFTMSLWAL